MNKSDARRQLDNTQMNIYDIAHTLYRATVEGISGAKQHGGYGFAVSALAELWNIRGTIGNPYAKTKITGRYRGMNITEQDILNVIQNYPYGFSEDFPLFDDLVLNRQPQFNSGSHMNSASLNSVSYTGDGRSALEDKIFLPLLVILFFVCKFVLGWGLILSLIASFFGTGLVLWVIFERK